jgi:hypothetical protein
MDASGVAAVAVGSVFTYAGIKGISVPQALQAIIQGKSPATLKPSSPISSPSDSGTSSSGGQPVTGGSAQQILQQTAAEFGWGSGSEWQALSSLEMGEAGFDPTSKNPSSGALGLAQALGHGTAATAGTLGNEYGGYGLTDAQAKAANSGDASMQALWMCTYIKTTYGDPSTAWSKWQARSPHWY